MSRPARRILMTTDAVGGVWTYSVELAQALGERGVEVALATMGPRPSDAQRRQVARIPGLHLFESGFALEWMDDPWRDVAAAGRWLLDLEAALAPDVVHLGGYAHGALPFRAPVVVGAHSCVLSWWRAVHGSAAPARYDRYRCEVAAGLERADAVTAPTAWMLGEVRRHYDVPIAGRVIPNARDPHAFRPATKQPLVLSAGRFWDPAKNLSALECAAERSPWPIAVAGAVGSPGDEPRAPERVRVLGVLPPRLLASWMARAGIYALPARYEPFGLSALEAALAGCALVLGDIPSLREVWGDDALFVDPADPEALGAALSLLASDRPLRLELACRARRRALGYAPQWMARAYQELYLDLVTYPEEARSCAS